MNVVTRKFSTSFVNGILPVLLMVALLNAGTSRAAEPLDSWVRRTSTTANTLSVVTYGNKLFVAVGLAGTIVTSSNGVTWTKRSSGTTEPIYGVIYGGDQFVAVGGNGLVATSPNGINWTIRRSGTGVATYTVAYGKGRYVAVGDVILTSTDGITWISQNVPKVSTLAGPLKNPDGPTLLIIPDDFRVHTLSGITFVNNQFLAVGAMQDIFSGTYYPKIMTSIDGVTWVARTAPGINFALNDGAYGNGEFVTVGLSGAVVSSANGINWSEQGRPSAGNLNSVTFAEGLFVTVGDNGKIFSSVDGSTWKARTSPTTQTIYEVTFGNGTFLAVGDGGTIIQSASFLVELGYSRAGDQITLSWNSPAYVLQQSDEFGTSAAWSLTPGGNVSPISITMDGGAKCYRLLKL
jgi:hypothetical protein